MMRRIETVLIAAVCAMSFMACSACGGGNSNPTGPVSKTSQFFLPTGEPRNTLDPHMQMDAQGNLHFVYAAYSQGDAYYAYCTSNCTSASQMKVVQLKTQGTVSNARVAVGSDGKPQILLNTFERVYLATCSGDCTQSGAWKVSPILEHAGKLEVSGDAFTVTADGKPRFIVHGFRSIGGASVHTTYYMQCDSNCSSPGSWTQSQISARNWVMGSLRLSAAGQPRLVYAELINGGIYMSNYIECDSGCTSPVNWKGTQLYRTFYGLTEELPMHAAMSLRLTSKGKPRVALMGDDGNGRNLVYLECDGNCGAGPEDWLYQIILPSDRGGNELKAGLELALDAQDRPRLAYSAAFNIVMGYCDSACTDETKDTWNLAKVEFSSDMKKDNIIPYPDCTISGGWFLNNPTIAIGKDGLPRIAYRAMDVSGGGTGNTGPGDLKCAAGPDMTFGRYTQLDSFRKL